MDQNTNKKPGMDLGNTQYFKVQPDQETGVKKMPAHERTSAQGRHVITMHERTMR